MDNDEEAFLHPNEEESTHKCSQYDIFTLVHPCEHHVQGTVIALSFSSRRNEDNVVLSPNF